MLSIQIQLCHLMEKEKNLDMSFYDRKREETHAGSCVALPIIFSTGMEEKVARKARIKVHFA